MTAQARTVRTLLPLRAPRRRTAWLGALCLLCAAGVWLAVATNRRASLPAWRTIHVPRTFDGYLWRSDGTLYLSRVDPTFPATPGLRVAWTYVTLDPATETESAPHALPVRSDLSKRISYARVGASRSSGWPAGPNRYVIQASLPGAPSHIALVLRPRSFHEENVMPVFSRDGSRVLLVDQTPLESWLPAPIANMLHIQQQNRSRFDLWAQDADGSGARLLASREGDRDVCPFRWMQWSPDGARVSFTLREPRYSGRATALYILPAR